ncbi:magnesium/cobalt transporter CorA [Buttiauxella agrestis]
MLSAFQLENNRLSRLELDEADNLSNSVWVDLVEPEESERQRVQTELGQSLATRRNWKTSKHPRVSLKTKTVCTSTHFSFMKMQTITRATAPWHSPFVKAACLRCVSVNCLHFASIVCALVARIWLTATPMNYCSNLFETKIEQLADEIENIYSDLEKLSRVIMEGHQGDEYDAALSTLAELEDIGWKVRLCLMDTQRALNFLVRKARLPSGQLEQAREILRDIESLLPHNESLFQKVNFLMQAAMGFINIEQNRIIKIFSVVSVVFLPPTLVASSYGMNFEFMPELKLSFGYPAAIIVMILAGLAPYLYFKRKNWL